MFAQVRDAALPALSSLDQAGLDRITGGNGARLLRARYQPGARAILHVALGPTPDAGEGSVWFYAGTKALGLSRDLPDARLDADTGALFQAFPQDHRLPHLARFVARAMEFAPRLIGGPADGPPRLLRYRPGLSATFRWTRADGRVVYVKQTPDQDVAAQAVSVTQLAHAAYGLNLGFPAVAGIIPELGLIAYIAAEGQALDHILANPDAGPIPGSMTQVAGALAELAALPVTPARLLDRDHLLLRADLARQMIDIVDPVAGKMAAQLMERVRAHPVPVRLRPIHGDMKLEHAFLSGRHTTLIDIESLSLGDPDHDLARLETRVEMSALTGRITGLEARIATTALRPYTGPHYPWFLDCARLHSAKFFAQRLDPATLPLMRHILGSC